jgi:hypothetical protein
VLGVGGTAGENGAGVKEQRFMIFSDNYFSEEVG